MRKKLSILLLLVICMIFVSCQSDRTTIPLPHLTTPVTDTDTVQAQTSALQTAGKTISSPNTTVSPTTPTPSPSVTPTPTEIVYRNYDFSSVSLKSSSSAVYDMYEDRFVYMKNLDEGTKIYPASMTKLYMIHVGMDLLSLDEIITAGNEISLVNPHSSFANISKGDRLTVRMIIEGMLLPSGNDAAYVLGRL